LRTINYSLHYNCVIQTELPFTLGSDHSLLLLVILIILTSFTSLLLLLITTKLKHTKSTSEVVICIS
jgi:hypothetical protein